MNGTSQTFLQVTINGTKGLIRLEEVLYFKTQHPLYGNGTNIVFGRTSLIVEESLEDIEAVIRDIQQRGSW